MEGKIDILIVFIISFFVFIYDIITFPIYLIIHAPLYKLSQSKIGKVSEVKIGNSKCKTYIYRVTNTKQEITYSGVQTVFDLMKISVNWHRYQKCLGTREILDVKEFYKPDGAKITKCIIGPYKWKTYNAVKDEVVSLSRGLHSLGVDKKMPLAILSERRSEWIISAMACFEKDITLVVLDLSMDSVCIAQSLKGTDSLAMITSENLLPKVLSCIDRLPTVKIIVYIENYKRELILNKFPDTISIHTYAEVCERGKNLIIEDNPPDPDDVAVVIFTKATTGLPKGVILTQRNLVSAVKGYHSHLHFNSNDIMIGYLPLSNIIELFLELTVMMAGGSIGYSSNFIDSDRSMKVIFGIGGDATVLQPTVMFAYPHLIEQLSKSITARIQTLGTFSRNLVKFGIAYKKFWTPKGFRTLLTNRIIFSRMAEVLGGNMRMIICGGAHLPASAQLYATVTLCSAVIQSYSLTENAAAGLCQCFADFKMGRVGKPLKGVYVRLEEIFVNHCLTDTPTAELILGGDCVSQGYSNLPGKTCEDYFVDGNIRWFRTGDVVVMHPNGSFELIDRKIDLIKLEHGKYVPLGKLEALYKMSECVNNICLYGDEGSKYLVAILIPDKDYISRLAQSFSLRFSTFDHFYSELKIKTAVADLLFKHAKSCNLSDHEIPAAVMLVDHEWTLESGLLTTNHQLKRKSAYAKYEAQIAYMYKELSRNENNSKKKREIITIAGN